MQHSAHLGTRPDWSSCWHGPDLDSFIRRMHAHGTVVSRTLMQFDSRYALEHLVLAHTFADGRLQALAVQLFESSDAQSAPWPSGA